MIEDKNSQELSKGKLYFNKDKLSHGLRVRRPRKLMFRAVTLKSLQDPMAREVTTGVYFFFILI